MRPASAERLLRAGITAGDRVALICCNRPGVSCSVMLGCGLDRRHCGADQHGLTRAAARAHLAQLRRAAAGRSKREFLDALGHVDDRRNWRSSASGSSAKRGGVALALPRHALAAAGVDPIAAARRRARRHARDPLHLGHDRPVEGRDAARTRSISGGASTAGMLGVARRRRALHHACRCSTPTRSNTFYQALLTGATLVARAALLGLAASGRARRARARP